MSVCVVIAISAPPCSSSQHDIACASLLSVCKGWGHQRCNSIHFTSFILLLFLLLYLYTYLSFTPLTCRKCGDEDTNNAVCLNKEERVPSWAAGQMLRVLRCIGKRGTRQSNRHHKSQGCRRTGGVVAGGRELDMPANKRWCCNK